MRTREAVKADRDALSAKRAQIYADIEAIEVAHEYTVRDGRQILGPPMTAGERERLDNLRRGLERINAQDTALADEGRDERMALIKARSENPMNVERTYDGPTAQTYDDDPVGARRAGYLPPEPSWERSARRDAFRTIERFAPRMTARAADRLDELVRRQDAAPEAAYIAAVGAPEYRRAFTKAVLDPQNAHLRFTEAERAAWHRVEETRAPLAIGGGATGGYAVPFLLDPTIVDVAPVALCPLRGLATVRTLTAHEARFVNADGVVAQYQAEAAAVPQAAPTLSQPALVTARGSAHVRASIEMLQDDPGIVSELTAMIAAGRDKLDATKFLIGSGTNEPLGILAVGTTGALSNTQRVTTAVADTVSAVDIYSLYNALDPGALGNLNWCMSPTSAAFLYRLTPVGSTTEPQLIPDFGGPMLGGPVKLWSTMNSIVTVSTTGHNVIVGGDFKAAVIVGDRLGMSVEVIPHLFDNAAPGLPTGERGLVAFWRSGVVTRDPNKLRFLQIT
jgi:HK97 family phage major capsid protein